MACLYTPVSRLLNRNVYLPSGRTSLRLEPEFWDALEAIATAEACTMNALVSRIDAGSGERTSAVRVFVLGWFKGRAA